MFRELGVKHVLLLQGPMGPFFARLAAELRSEGIAVTKVNFNAGDALYYPSGRAFRGAASALPAFLDELRTAHGIDAFVLFGDGRPYHRIAIQVARERGIPVYVLEEGYLRPDWITCEEGGVNGNSSLARDPDFYRAFESPEEPDRAETVGPTFRIAGWHSTAYSLAMTLGAWAYPEYRHHRSLNAFLEAYRWVRGGVRKWRYARRERDVLPRLVANHSHKYFLVALQVHCDYQLAHSPFADVESFIELVVRSFAQRAPRDELLVIKHHPMDRPYREYGELLGRLAVEHGLGDRLIYVHDLHLPTLLKHAKGTVMINSTVGLQAIHYGTPVKVLGSAVYDMVGLTSQQSLDEFWSQPGMVDAELYRRFRAYLLHTNQCNGSFYKRLPGVHSPTGIRWLSPRPVASEPTRSPLR